MPSHSLRVPQEMETSPIGTEITVFSLGEPFLMVKVEEDLVQIRNSKCEPFFVAIKGNI